MNPHIIQQHQSNVAETWFEGLNCSDMSKLLGLFGPNGARIRNAAQPLISGAEGPRRLLEDFFARTESRHFAMIDHTITANEVVAGWHGILTFRAGIQIADAKLTKPLSVALRGVDRFVLDSTGRVVEIAIDHETTSVVQAARAAKMRDQVVPDPKYYEGVIRAYFKYEESGDVDGVVQLCDPAVIVRNAAQPLVLGHAGVRGYVESFRDRTESREFEIVSIGTGSGIAYAGWKAKLRFKAGIAFGPVTSKAPFDIALEGTCRFAFNATGKLVELDVYHETTSALKRAHDTCLPAGNSVA